MASAVPQADINTTEVLFNPVGGNVDHSKQKTQNLSQFFNSPDFSDVQLVLEGQNYFVHKVILASTSTVFR